MKIKSVKFRTYGNKKIGLLSPFYLNKHFKGFKIKRFFIINGNNKVIRADHAHFKSKQIFIPIRGSTKIRIITQDNKLTNYIISEKNKKFLIVPKLHWVKIKFIEKQASVLVLCDYEYNRKEYILDLKKFLK